MGRTKSLKLTFFLILFLVLTRGILSAQQTVIDNGIQWLKDNQNISGSWGDEEMIALSVIDTTAALNTLHYLDEVDTNYTNGILWLGTQTVISISLLSIKIESLAKYGTDTSSLISTLISYQKDDGAFGEYQREILSTILALRALKTANYSDEVVINNAISYILSNQNQNGGFGIVGKESLADESMKESNICVTSLVILTFKEFNLGYSSYIDKAVDWLMSQRNEDGNFGNSIWETSLSYSALMQVASGKWLGASEKTLNYILNAQLANGSWNDDAYSTALALRALKDSAPDLAIRWQDISFEPEVPVEGEPVTIKATVWNYGGTLVENVEVVIGNQLSVISKIEAGGSASVTVVSNFTAGTYKIIVTVDPDDLVKERDETNNTASKNLTSSILADLTLSPADISFAPAKPTDQDIIRVNATIYNQGEVDVYRTVVSFYAGNPATGGTKLADLTLTSEGQYGIPGEPILPNGGNVKIWVISTEPFPADTYDIYVVADSQNMVTEIDETNNIAYKTLIVTGTPTISAPTGLIAIPGKAIVDLSWSPNPEKNLAGYNLYRDGANINTELILITTYRDTGLVNGVSYTYTVTATDKEGSESNPSTPASATPQDYYINPPTITSPTIAGTPIWTNTTPITISGKTEPNTTVELFVEQTQQLNFGG
ncbi:MAG: CARDB domain-containing protein [bacterium]|nr:CARDB domain-containing protein [bacterium]